MADTINALDVGVFTVPVDPPESDGTLSWDHTTVVTVRIAAGDQNGLGWTYGPEACGTFIDKVLRSSVIGACPMDIPAVWAAMVRSLRNAGRPGVCSMAVAAVDVALWDLKARLLDEPLARLLGQAVTAVPLYGSGGFTSMPTPALVEQLAGWVSRGFTRVKMKIGNGLSRDLERVAAVREAIGPDIELFVDANGAYRVKEAVRLCRGLESLGVTWFEEPVSSDNLDGLRKVSQLTTIDVAAGEYGYDLVYFARMCEAPSVDVVQVDVSRCAGITDWLRVAAIAAARGLQISGHCAPALHLPVAGAVPNLAHVEYFADHARVDSLLFDGVPVPVAGELRPDLTRAGHGMELKDLDAARYAA